VAAVLLTTSYMSRMAFRSGSEGSFRPSVAHQGEPAAASLRTAATRLGAYANASATALPVSPAQRLGGDRRTAAEARASSHWFERSSDQPNTSRVRSRPSMP
jgi:hypothetical protein